MLGAGSRRGKTAAAALRRQAVGGRDTAACCSFGVLTMKILATLPAIGRDLRLDLFRGVANWGIFLDHIPNNIVNWVTTRNYGFSDAADLFIFISGYTVAFVFARVMLERGFIIGCTLLCSLSLSFVCCRAIGRGWNGGSFGPQSNAVSSRSKSFAPAYSCPLQHISCWSRFPALSGCRSWSALSAS